MAKKAQTPIRTVYHAPIRDQSSGGYLLGIVCRTLLIALGGMSFPLVWLDAFRMTFLGDGGYSYVSSGLVILTALLVSAGMTLSSLNVKTYHTVPLAGAGVLTALAMILYSPFVYIDALTALWNQAASNLKSVSVSYGYLSTMQIPFLHERSASDETLITVGALLMVTVLTVIFSRSILYGVKALPLGLTTGVVILPIFVLNLFHTNYGVALLFAFTVGVIALWIGDRRFLGYLEARTARKEKKLKKRLEKKQKKQQRQERKAAEKRRISEAYFAAYDATGSSRKARVARRKEKKKIRKEKADAKKLARHPEYEFELSLRRSRKKLTRKDKKAIRAYNRAAVARRKEENKKQKEQRKAEKVSGQAERKAEALKKKDYELLYRRHLVSCTGYAGSLAALLAFVVAMLAAFQVNDRFPIIPEIYDPVSVLNEEVTAFVTGGDIDLNELAKHIQLDELKPRTISLEPMPHSSVPFLTVFSGSSLPLYLRHWASGLFDLEKNTWNSPSTDQVDAYRDTFGTSFTPDSILNRYLSLMYQNRLDTEVYGQGRSFYETGFATAYVTVQRTDGNDYLLYLPSFMRRGLLAPDSMEKHFRKFTHYYEGIYSSRNFRKSGSYGAYALLTNYRYGMTVATSLEENLRGYDAFLRCVIAYETLKTEVTDDRTKVGREMKVPLLNGIAVISKNEEGELDFGPFLDLAHDYMKENGINARSIYLLDAYVNTWSEAERRELFDQVSDELMYRRYVYAPENGYTVRSGSGAVADLARQILEENGIELVREEASRTMYLSPEEVEEAVLNPKKEKTTMVFPSVSARTADRELTRYELVMSVINYLSDHYDYNVVPHTGGVEFTYDAVAEQFLFNVKEGYCSHFATAACLLLREFGIPCRYVEGAMISSYYLNNTDITTLKYKGYVAEKNLHAWIEVYFDGMGWLQFETTPVYYETMYPKRVEEIVPVTRRETTEPILEPEDSDEEGEEEEPIVQPAFPKELVIACGVGLLVMLIAVCAVSAVRNRTKRRLKKRASLISAALAAAGKHEQNEQTRQMTREMEAQISAILTTVGIAPVQGELSEEYGERLAREYGSLSETDPRKVMRALQEEEFGHGVTGEDLACVAHYLTDLTKNVYAALSLPEKMKTRYFKNIL